MHTPTDLPETVPPLPSLMTEPIVRAALLEDLGRAGDITSQAVVPAAARSRLALVARQGGVLAGLELARMAFTLVDPEIRWSARLRDGARLAPGSEIATLEGSARSILTAERTALNLLTHLSGVASATARIAEAIAHTRARVTCTRKTLPGLRALQKYAVRVGGGSNHRFGLDDALLIKDNHVALAGGLAIAIERARAAAGHMVQMEVEVDTLAQLREALALRVPIVLLDNMDVATLRAAVELTAGRAVLEASGGVTEQSAPAIAATGVDLLSVGSITHSVVALDIGLDA